MPQNQEKYRIYIDEVGNHDLKNVDNPNQRYLSLTGVVFELGYVAQILFPKLEALKTKYFKSHPDDPTVLHRKELVNKKPPFETLRNPTIEQSFNHDLLSLLTDLDYTVFTVVIDKKQHKEQYLTWRFDPYHYCLQLIIERFVLFLKSQNAVGDVMCESRGGKEDVRLKKSFHRIFTEGTEFISHDIFSTHLTSSQLKVKPKANNISGLQIADLIAHPSYKRILYQKGRTEKLGRYGEQIVQILENQKYYRGPSNQLWGYGKKWLP